MKVLVGLLALQGDFWKHQERLRKLGADFRLVRTIRELSPCTHLIIPGGESTTLNLLLDSSGLRNTVVQFSEVKPVWGTCAGMILLAKKAGDEKVKPLGAIDIEVNRNAYGRQIDSFTAAIKFPALKFSSPFHAIFIRAPKLDKYGPSVTPLGKWKKSVVMARNSRILVTSFHPELTDDTRIHRYFIEEMNHRP